MELPRRFPHQKPCCSPQPATSEDCLHLCWGGSWSVVEWSVLFNATGCFFARSLGMEFQSPQIWVISEFQQVKVANPAIQSLSCNTQATSGLRWAQRVLPGKNLNRTLEVCDVRLAEAKLLQAANTLGISSFLCRCCSQIICYMHNLPLASGTESRRGFSLYFSPSFSSLGSTAMRFYDQGQDSVSAGKRMAILWAFWIVFWRWWWWAVSRAANCQLCLTFSKDQAELHTATLHAIQVSQHFMLESMQSSCSDWAKEFIDRTWRLMQLHSHSNIAMLSSLSTPEVSFRACRMLNV